MNRLLRTSLINFLSGGFTIAMFAVLAEVMNFGLVGNLMGALPILTTYMIFYSYATSTVSNTTTLAWQGAIAAIIYIIFNITFALVYPRINNVICSYFIALGVWIICQIILIFAILPKFGIKLLKKDIFG